MTVYLKQNDNFLPFLTGGIYANWKPASENDGRIETLHVDDPPDTDNGANRATKLAKRQKDLLTMLNMIARKVDQYDYDDVMKESNSVQSIWNMIELVYNIGRKGVHFLDLNKIKYEKEESPAKFYKKIYHHFMDNLYKKNETLTYKNTVRQDDEKLSPTLLNFILYYRALETQLSAFGNGRGGFRGRGRGRGQGGGGSRPYQQQQPGGRRLFCRLCQAAKCPPQVYSSHNVSTCNRWTRKDVEDLRVMMCEMQTDPEEWPESETDQD